MTQNTKIFIFIYGGKIFFHAVKLDICYFFATDANQVMMMFAG